MYKIFRPLNIAVISFIFSSFFSYAQTTNDNSFDFWVGDWELSWTAPDGSTRHGLNKISKILDDKVIREDFMDLKSGFKGISLSIYNKKTKIWHQTWVDNNGGHFDFIGGIINGNPTFKTKSIKLDDKKNIKRMVFKNVSKNSLDWIWEGTNNGGKTWQLIWKIKYNRKISKSP